jgi:CheY-like chemotaxis protein
MAMVLLAEDNEVAALFCKTVLEEMGHEVLVTDNVPEAIRILNENDTIDMALLDCRLLCGTGEDIAHHIKESVWPRRSVRLPTILLLTAGDDVPMVEGALSMTKDEFREKLVRPQEAGGFDEIMLRPTLAIKETRQQAAARSNVTALRL